ncbi:nucleotide-binding protein [Streptomyces prunicolor]|uniref:nucleotide-binding protein n=1 Tax=Streptomyces prunicolor TaxID=67348 RepID=UPI0022563F7D|nr:nucleotide-binding protein [Streptomyces prunicolor]MCX5235946.1 nucleotide-binding protein [Streptomyces prunicolor]
MSEQELEERFLKPYREGRPIIIGGTTVPMGDLERIQINQTDQDASQILPIVRERRRNSGVVSFISNDYYIAAYGDDVTDRYITSEPGVEVTGSPSFGTSPSGVEQLDSRRVFVVHGRNYKARDAMFSFLRSIELRPVEWIEAVAATGKSSPYVGEILDVAFRQAAAVLVLMTPDDNAWLKEEYQGAHEPPHETQPTGQARANVLFEAGMAIGRDEDRTILVELGAVRPFSDIGGRHVIRINNSTQRRQELAQRLLDAGCSANMSGTDWHTFGDFDGCL